MDAITQILQQIERVNQRVKDLERQELPMFTSSLNVGIGGSPSYKLDVFGSFRAQNTILSGTLTVPTLTSGSIPFIGAGGLVLQDNANLFWDNANKRLRVPAITIPSADLGVLDISDISGIGQTGIELGGLATGNRYAYIDFHGDDTNTDFGLRLIRNNTGANANSQILHKGTGELGLVAVDAGSLALYTSNLSRLSINSSGTVTINQGLNVGSATGAPGGAVHASGYVLTSGNTGLPSYGVVAMGYDGGAPRGLVVSIDTGTYKPLDIESSKTQLKYQTTVRFALDSTGIGFFAVTPVARQTGGAATAGASYTATEQGMINRMYTALRNYGLLT